MPCACCCSECQGEGCCGGDHPRTIGVCCDGEWRMPDDPGVCCGGVWYATGTPGQCCEGVWRTEGGDCCNGVWYPAENPCPAGMVYLRYGPDQVCCGCVPETTIYEGEEVATESIAGLLCCDCGAVAGLVCPQRCCVDGACTEVAGGECAGQLLAGCCDQGCPIPCCFEDEDGISQCEERDSSACVFPAVPANPADCVTGCVGECCIDGVSQGQLTQSACDAIGGEWGGVGSTECPALPSCRHPLDAECCETVQSSGAGLTFTQPRRSRTPPLSLSRRVTVTGYTDSPILIHGTPFGRSGSYHKRCPINHTFVLCWDKFNVEPVPCGTNFWGVDLTVCWDEQAASEEVLPFSGCDNITVWLGYCPNSCATTLTYGGSGHTSNATVEVLCGPATIEANGSGPLVLTTPIVFLSESPTTLVLQGNSTLNNSISGAIQDASQDSVTVEKRGSGRWLLSSATSSFTGGVQVQQGELVLAASTTNDASGSLGAEPASAPSASVGSDTLPGTPALLLGQGVTVSHRVISVAGSATQVAILGGASGTSTFSGAGFGQIDLARDVQLQAEAGSTVRFSVVWSFTGGSAKTIDVGSSGKTGTVELLRTSIAGTGVLGTTGQINVNYGTLKISNTGILPSASKIDIGANGTLLLADNPAYSSGSVDQISADVALAGPMTVNRDGTVTLSGVMSGVGGLTNNGQGLVTLSGVNTRTGVTTINAGTVRADHILAFGSGDIVVNQGGTLNKNGYALANNIINNNGTVLN